ncbi:uncharacterized protein FOMMEDRAFT_159698 [Fomitiporia mediterranea MF3/22]|uniref:uncharacterized protein n=1 Tax=Fomitiporia mediterranea (strain MF3/22) TaxID=694068 RepID=UPI00044098A6|nr:uncharacterized protein FOMMEDRAFT_159698 [Fomitiporia mediterranea MF3/22]EJD00086.1 hypothetical protein FOMMEDRAFT_159698 [Fomitiporia mediterranea MF3/22]
MDASTPVCPMIAPMHSLISPPALNCGHHSLSIHPLSLPFFCSCPPHPATHLACIVFHYTAFAGFLGPSQRPLALPVTITSTVCPIGALPVPLSIHHTSGSVDLEQESKHLADFSKQPDNGTHDDNDNDDEGLRPSGSGGASSARQASGSSRGIMRGNAGMSGRNKGGTGFNSSFSKYFCL